MNTIQLRLEPDPEFPQFKRMHWSVIPVSLEDVLDQGIHPWTHSNPYDLVRVFQERLNEDPCRPKELASHGFAHDLSLEQSSYGKESAMERALKRLHECAYFIEELSFEELFAVARNRLIERWNTRTALSLAERLHHAFNDLRRFLKSKEKAVKLSGQADLADYDWGSILSIDDFAHHERLIIEQAVQPLNFRLASAIEHIADDDGRLRLKPRMETLTLHQKGDEDGGNILQWRGVRKEERWHLSPAVGASQLYRQMARAFAEKCGNGGYCFHLTTKQICDIVGVGDATINFPHLRYSMGDVKEAARAQLPKKRMQWYELGGVPMDKMRGDVLKDILREYDAPISGTKAVLIKRLAKVAAELYEQCSDELSVYFGEYRFVRADNVRGFGAKLPVLEDEGRLRGILLHMYALTHLRGNVILDPGHQNESCTPYDLALAIIQQRVKVNGGLIEAG